VSNSSITNHSPSTIKIVSPDITDGESSSADKGIAAPSNSVGFSLSQVGLETSRQFGGVVGALGLEPREFAILHAVHRHSGQAQQTIGDLLAIPASTMVAIVDHLENEELLERRPHKTDRRARTLHLTVRGETLLASAMVEAMKQEAHICTGLEPQERMQLLSLLRRVAVNLGMSSTALPDRGSGNRPQGI
jgi:DNA-binding MarR family transcriptional regulator